MVGEVTEREVLAPVLRQQKRHKYFPPSSIQFSSWESMIHYSKCGITSPYFSCDVMTTNLNDRPSATLEPKFYIGTRKWGQYDIRLHQISWKRLAFDFQNVQCTKMLNNDQDITIFYLFRLFKIERFTFAYYFSVIQFFYEYKLQ